MQALIVPVLSVFSLSFFPLYLHTFISSVYKKYTIGDRGERGCSLKSTTTCDFLGWIFEWVRISTSAWILCSTLNSPWNTASRGASSGEQKGIWEQIKNMNSNIPVAASACAQDYRVLRRLLAGEERLQVLKTFHFHLWRMHHAHRHPQVSFTYSFGFDFKYWVCAHIFHASFTVWLASHPHINSVLSHKKSKDFSKQF